MASSSSIRQAMILAAGRGLRFRPVTDAMPKPLVPVAGKPLIDWQMEMLAAEGIERVVVNGCYLRDMLKDHVMRHRFGMEIIFSEEDAALETGGGIKHALSHFNGQPFFAINADVILYPHQGHILSQLAAAFDKQPQADLALLLHPRVGAIGISGAGDFFCNEYGLIWRRGRFMEAPFYFTGVQLMRPNVFEKIEASIFSMNVVYDQLLEENNARIVGIINQQGNIMLHVGDPEGHQASEAFLAEKGIMPVTDKASVTV